MKSNSKALPRAVIRFSALKLMAALALCLSLNSCLGIAVGAASATVGVGIAVAKVPVKIVGKAAGATLGLILPDGKE
jgi:hypothetical protein